MGHSFFPARLSRSSSSTSIASSPLPNVTSHPISYSSANLHHQRNPVPMRSKHDSVSPARDMGNGLTLNVNVLKVCHVCITAISTD
jgi:hypothetical protein